MLVRAFVLLLAWSTACLEAHPQCWTDEKSVDLEGELDFCSTSVDAAYGICCTDAEEEAVLESVSSVVGSLTTECADLYKKVQCAICGPYSGHLYARLDGLLTMTNSFCTSFTSACAGQLDFEEDYCVTRTGGEDDTDFFWSYPYASPELFESGLDKVFPDLPEDDMPGFILSVHHSPDGRMYWLSGKSGIILQVNLDSMSSSSTVMDLSGGDFAGNNTSDGLLDFAFGPMFETNSYFYVSYNIDDGSQRNRLSKFVYSEGDPVTTRNSEDVLFQSAPKTRFYHNGGWVGFKPSAYGTDAPFHDLYWSIGDSGPQEDPNGHGQSSDTIFGSMVRISVPSDGVGYEIPSGNYPGGIPEICAIGFRVPWRCSFDKANDDLYCGDIGYEKVEFVHIVECGNNYGWVRFEGNRCTEFSEEEYGPCLDADRSFRTPPVFEYCHFSYYSDAEGEGQYTGGYDICGDRTIEGNCVIGGHVYRGEAYADLLYGAYIFADYTGRNIYYIKKQADGTWVPGTIVSDGSVRVVSFAETVKGELFVVDILNNVYHLPCGDLCLGVASNAISSETDGNYSYIGCYADDPTDQVLTGSSVSLNATMTAQVCSEFCLGSKYFGTEFSTECFCGSSTDVPNRLGDGLCYYDCSGNVIETCGGNGSISVYEYNISS